MGRTRADESADGVYNPLMCRMGGSRDWEIIGFGFGVPAQGVQRWLKELA
jgi:hypothetical protein